MVKGRGNEMEYVIFGLWFAVVIAVEQLYQRLMRGVG